MLIRMQYRTSGYHFLVICCCLTSHGTNALVINEGTYWLLLGGSLGTVLFFEGVECLGDV
jgi:hypothetical protein